MNTLKISFAAALTISMIIAVFCLFGIMFNPHGFWQFLADVRDGTAQALHAAAIGAIILFFAFLGLGIAYVAVHIRTKARVIEPTRYGPTQAVQLRDGNWLQLTSPAQQIDPMQQLQMLKTVIQMQNQMAQLARRSIVEEKQPAPQIAAPSEETIPAIVAYSSVSEQVPTELSLLGIHPMSGALEIVSPEQLKTAWFVGGSNMGKTNTVYGKVSDAVRWGAKMIVCDNHAEKPDSLANKLKDFHHRLLIPLAQTDEDIKRAVIRFLKEFHQRRDHSRSCAEKWLIVCDEVNATGNHVVKLTEQEEQWLYDAYGVKVEDHRVKLMVFFKILAETCGYESRGFGMFGFFISQKVAGLSWLRNAMMTVFVHGLLMYSEALLAANNNRQRAEEIMKFKKGRTLVYGYEVDEMILQQPLYEPQVVESTIESVAQSAPQKMESSNQAEIDGVQTDVEGVDHTFPFDFSKLQQVRKMILEKQNQNDIICAVWNVTENTRAFRTAKEEFRHMLAYLASMAGETGGNQ